MKFKDGAIKPGMVIECTRDDEVKSLRDYLQELGYKEEDRTPLMRNYCVIDSDKSVRWVSLIGPAAANSLVDFTELLDFD